MAINGNVIIRLCEYVSHNRAAEIVDSARVATVIDGEFIFELGTYHNPVTLHTVPAAPMAKNNPKQI